MAVVFWDFDGTLVYSNHLWSNSVFSALKQTDSNTKIQFKDIRKCMATGFTWHTPYNDELQQMTGSKWWNFMINKIRNDCISLGADIVIADTAAKMVPEIIKKRENYTLYDDCVETLKSSIYFGNKNVILSNNFPDLIDVLIKLDLVKFFDDVIVSAEIGYDKPRREIFEYAKLKYPDEKYIMIGDSITADIIGGKNAGMKTVLVHNGFCPQADFCFNRLDEIDFTVTDLK